MSIKVNKQYRKKRKVEKKIKIQTKWKEIMKKSKHKRTKKSIYDDQYIVESMLHYSQSLGL